jgi:heat shock protein HtpX
MQNNAPDFDLFAVRKQLFLTWLRTIGGIALLAAFGFGTLTFLGLNIGPAAIIIGVGAVALPVYTWYNSAQLITILMKCEEADPFDEDHARLLRILDELYPQTGLKVKPRAMVSPIPVPNAFATGRNPANAFIAVTEGIFMVDLSDDELKAVLAHELAHVKTYDVAITSLTTVLGSLFAIVIATSIPWFFRQAYVTDKDDVLGKLSEKVKKDKKNFADPVTIVSSFALTLVVFIVVNFFAKFVTFFVSRSRESAADALACKWTGNPCALVTSLLKIDDWMDSHTVVIPLRIIMGGLTPMLFLNLHNEVPESPESLKGKLKIWWEEIGENHPPVPERIAMLESFGGTTCPTIDDIMIEREERFNELLGLGKLRLPPEEPPPPDLRFLIPKEPDDDNTKPGPEEE